MLVPVVDMKRTGQNIASLRAQKGISVRELQRMLGFATPQHFAAHFKLATGMPPREWRKGCGCTRATQSP